MRAEPEIREQFKQALQETIFSHRGTGFLESPRGEIAMRQHLYVRYDHCVRFTIPWLSRCTNLHNKKVLEIGCGTGSIAAALATQCHSVFGYDINTEELTAAWRRFELLELQNVHCRAYPESSIFNDIQKEHPPKSFDIIIMFALLEHMTIPERLDVLRFAWEMAADDGVIMVGETPNRLIYPDEHSSHLDFFNLIPDELALLYYEKSPQTDFKKAVAASLKKSPEEGRIRLIRYGRGVSHHEFELALGDLEKHIVLNGFEPEIMKLRGMPSEEEVFLYSYFIRRNLKIPFAFSRKYLDFIICKKKQEHLPVYNIPLQYIHPRKSSHVIEKDNTIILHQKSSLLEYNLPKGSQDAVIRLQKSPFGGLLQIEDNTGRLLHKEDLYQPHWSTEFIPIKTGAAEEMKFTVSPKSSPTGCHALIDSIIIR